MPDLGFDLPGSFEDDAPATGFKALLGIADNSVKNILGSSVTYTPGVGQAVVVQGVFDAAFQKSDAGRAGAVGFVPAVFLRIGDLPTDPQDDLEARVTVEDVEYSIREPREDGQGGVLLYLNRVD